MPDQAMIRCCKQWRLVVDMARDATKFHLLVDIEYVCAGCVQSLVTFPVCYGVFNDSITI